MPNFISARFPAPESYQEFEKMVNIAASIKWAGSFFQRYGRPGQQQDGVDTYGQTGKGRGIAIQCKNTIHTLPLSVIESEIEKATKFTHPIMHLFIATTQPNDRSIQDDTWQISRTREAKGEFAVSILFWEDVIFELTKDRATIISFYPELAGPLHDEEIGLEIKTLLPYNGSIDFVRENGCCGSDFDDKDLHDLYHFLDRCRDPSFAFRNQDLEILRKKLREKITILIGTIGQHYTRGIHSQKIEFHHYNDRDYAESVWRELEYACDAVFDAYENLLRPQ